MSYCWVWILIGMSSWSRLISCDNATRRGVLHSRNNHGPMDRIKGSSTRRNSCVGHESFKKMHQYWCLLRLHSGLTYRISLSQSFEKLSLTTLVYPKVFTHRGNRTKRVVKVLTQISSGATTKTKLYRGFLREENKKSASRDQVDPTRADEPPTWWIVAFTEYPSGNIYITLRRED